MLYSIGFRDGSGRMCEYNGTRYIYIDEKGAEGLKAVCGEYPQRWDCRSAKRMQGIFEAAIPVLIRNKTRVESSDIVMLTLRALIDRCKAFPHAVLEVDW